LERQRLEAGPALGVAEVERYRRDGYLVVSRPVLPDEEFRVLAERLEATLASRPPEQRPESLDAPHFADPVLFRWLLAPSVLDLVTPLLGPDLALFSSHLICKPAGHGQRVPWHEDSAYWKGQLEPMEVVTVWLAVDPSRRENGCMKVVPGTHRHRDSEYERVEDRAGATFAEEIRDPKRFAERAVALELSPNRASLHDGRIIHGSEANSSPRRRCGYTMRYVSTRTRFDHDRHPWHQMYLARGRDHAGNRYGDPDRAYPELLRSRGRVLAGH
jgi:Phytanoyl-CoA dioxygenase (PhyH)